MVIPLTQSDDSPSPPTEQRLRRIGGYVGAVFFGGMFGLVVVLVFVRANRPNALPSVSRTELDRARQTWNQAAIRNYELQVRVSGREPSQFFVRVIDDNVVEAQRNGVKLKQQRTWGTWSVPGMFETMERDVANVEKQQAGQADPATPQLLLRGRFDPVAGYPLEYQRTEMRKFGANYEVSWEVIRLTPIEDP